MPSWRRTPPGRRAVALGAGFIALVLVADALILGVALAQRREPAPAGRGSPGAPASSGTLNPSAGPSAASSPGARGGTAVLVGAGDIGECGSVHPAETAALVAAIPGIVFTTGDNAYSTGSAAEFRRCYDPSWGRFRDRTRPAIGNHDGLTAWGAPYFSYFGAAAGAAPDAWYSYQAGTWHVVVLDSNCPGVDGCGEGSAQLAWLRSDVAAHPDLCTLAIWHHPRFSSGEHGDSKSVAPLWDVLYAAGAELVVNGHDHDYERFAPQTPTGALDPARGIREIIVGTGGKALRHFRQNPDANSEVRNASSYGVLRLDLAPGGYAWQFVAAPPGDFGDSGRGVCH
jgi:Calcineurin-like phosphoesterase